MAKKEEDKKGVMQKIKKGIVSAFQEEPTIHLAEQVTKIKSQNAEAIKEVKKERSQIEDALERFKVGYPEEASQMGIFWANLRKKQDLLDETLGKLPVKWAFDAVKSFAKDKSIQRTYYSDLASRVAGDEKRFNEALAFFGFTPKYFAHMCRTEADRLKVQIDLAADKREENFQDQVGLAQNKGDREYMRELRERYNVKEEAVMSNNIDLAVRAASEENPRHIPAFQHLVEMGAALQEFADGCENLASVNKYREILKDAVDANMYEYHKAARDETLKETTEAARIKKVHEDENATVKTIQGDNKLQTQRKEDTEREIRELQRLREAEQKELDNMREQSRRQYSQNQADISAAQERLRNIEAQQREAQRLLSLKTKQKDFDERDTLEPLASPTEPKSEGPERGKQPTPERAIGEALPPHAGWLRTTDGAYIKAQANQYGKHVRQIGVKRKAGGSISDEELTRLKLANKIVEDPRPQIKPATKEKEKNLDDYEPPGEDPEEGDALA